MSRRTRSPKELANMQASWFVDAEGVIRWRRDANAGVKAGDAVGKTVGPSGHLSVFLSFDGLQRGHTYGAVCWFLYYGAWPECEIDHIDRNPQNNRKENLRQASRRQNQCNRVVENKCGQQGVYKRKSGRYSAQVWSHGKAISLGTYDTAEQAGAVRAEAAKRIHGAFAVAS